MNDQNHTRFPNDSRPETGCEPLGRFEELAMLAAFGELPDEEREEFEACLASDEARRNHYQQIQETRGLAAALTPSRPKPETVSTILAAAQKAAEDRKALARRPSRETSGIWESIRAWIERPAQWQRWAAAGACACLMFVLLGPLFQTTTPVTDTTVLPTPTVIAINTNEASDLTDDATLTELMDLEIATVEESLGYMEEEMGLWLEEMDVS